MRSPDIGDGNRLRIAYFSPFPPDRSGIADYSKELLPYLAQYAEITLFGSKPEILAADFGHQFKCRHLDHFPRDRNGYDAILYQMGNSEYHEPFYPTILQYPGIVDLHDYYLHHFIANHTLGQADFAAYTRELAYVKGEEGYYLAQEIIKGTKTAPLYDQPLNERVRDTSLGLITHSHFVADKMRRQGFNRPLFVIPQIVLSHPGQSYRHKLNLKDENILFASFGLITTAKQIDFALETFRRVRQKHPQAHFLLVGEALPEADPGALIQEMGLTDVVHHIGYVADLNEFVGWIHTADIVINLRNPTAGETSSTALRAMAAGLPVIVFDHGWYSEIADGAAIKVPVMDADGLFTAMSALANSSALRKRVGGAARRVIERDNHPSAVAQAYASALVNTLKFYWRRYD